MLCSAPPSDTKCCVLYILDYHKLYKANERKLDCKKILGEKMAKMYVIKRNGDVVAFEESRLNNAISKAVRASKATIEKTLLDDLVIDISTEVENRFTDMYPNVENIQDIIEKHLVKRGLYEISKAYILYRAERIREREETQKVNVEKSMLGKLVIQKQDGRKVLFDLKKIQDTMRRVSKGYEDEVNVEQVIKQVINTMYDGITTVDIEKSLILSCNSFIEKEPAYTFISARLFMQRLYKEVIGQSMTNDMLGFSYRETFVDNIKRGVKENVFTKELLDYDLDKMSYGLKLERDDLFQYMGIQTLYERYFMKLSGDRIELPQAFWMRVAMGLALNEKDKEEKALEFYDVISRMRYVPSTPTLFHSATMRPQLSSCYLTTVSDDLTHIFKSYSDNAQLSKWSGGIGNDWTNIRSTGSWIKSTGVESQGVIPFLKIANDVTAAINRSGKRRGATCAYLETWHLDIEEFLDLRKNTGDDRRRTHDMNTANWIPDLFMKRVQADENWTLFSPDEVPDLHESYGQKFEEKYAAYEIKAQNGEIRKHKVVPAKKIWRKMLSMLFETGHPWFTFKDPCNIRSPQDHCGVIHSSNLCTEITLNTSADETAVCNLGSINLSRHVKDGKLDEELIARTTKTAMRMLDNVIDLNYYPTIEAQNSNMRHRPVGLGIMGLQDLFFLTNLPFESQAALQLTDTLMELVSYHAILTSSEIAKEKGPYESFKGSKWDRGIFPLDTLSLLEKERGKTIAIPKDERLNWTIVRSSVKQHGIRNSNLMAIAPTATISTISGCFPCIEPIYKNIYVKANMSGEFTIINSYLVQDLKRLNLWNDEMFEQLKYYDGNISMIAGIPEILKAKYKEAFDIDAKIAIKHTALRAKWIDQSQSHNVFLKGTNGTLLSETYMYAWEMGLKTTYYLRSLAATQIEKSTLDANKFGFTQKREYTNTQTTQPAPTPQAASKPTVQVVAGSGSLAGKPMPKACLIEDPDCEACQ
ncbi:MAG: ribonucleoside-diphosphate reductase alpha chain [Candidatus Woesearchaeota archaeon]|jgi:ribonucleoside-diphosphate reductase alpha chain